MNDGDSITFDFSGSPRVVRGGFARDQPGRSYPEHTLECYEFDYISNGLARWRINDQELLSQPGWLYSFLPGDVASGVGDPAAGPYHCRWVKFQWPARAQGLVKQESIARIPRVLRLSPEGQRTLPKAFDALLEAFYGGWRGWEIEASGNLLVLLGIIVRESQGVGRQSGQNEDPVDRRLALSLTFMERNRTQPIKMEAVAASAGWTADHFARLFRKRMGISPLQYLIRLRLQEGRRLLAKDPLVSVAEAARLAGFGDTRHFATVFRHHFGTTPNTFRRSILLPRPSKV